MTDATAPTLRRPRPPRALISLVAMIDVLLILLVFFMVTSTYLDLDMIAAVSPEPEAEARATPETPAPTARPLLVRIGADGAPVVRGRTLTPEALETMLRARAQASPAAAVMVLPTGVARTQALVSVMEAATRAGIRNLRVIRLEPRP